MAFQLNSVVPWGRTLAEYERMFLLTPANLKKKIIGFGDGPASFNVEMKERGNPIISSDPVYQFTTQQIRKRIAETSEEITTQMQINRNKFIWTDIHSVDELKRIRMAAMDHFLTDFKAGLAEQRYLPHSLPDKTNFGDDEFESGLSSHFLLLYDGLGFDFHQAALKEITRICKEARIFPIVNLNGETPAFFNDLLADLNTQHQTEIIAVPYEFQKGANKMLVIKKRIQ